MKGKLEFDLPEEQIEFRDASQGTKYYCALYDLKDLARNIEEYPEDYPHYRIVNIIREIMPGEIYE